jgi:DNA-binding MarR family transcriptional regulator
MKEQRDERLVVAIRTVIRLSRIAQQVCEQMGLTLPQYRALSMSVRIKRRAHEIATYTAVSRPAIAALTAGLERLKLVEREVAESDKRGVYFVASAEGRKAVAEAEREMAIRFADVLGDSVDVLNVLASPAFEKALDNQAEREFGPATQIYIDTSEPAGKGRARSKSSKKKSNGRKRRVTKAG